MFKPRPYDPDRGFNPGTKKQQVARMRNFRIFRLRGLYWQLSLLTGWRRKAARFLVDLELIEAGAQPETVRDDIRNAMNLCLSILEELDADISPTQPEESQQ